MKCEINIDTGFTSLFNKKPMTLWISNALGKLTVFISIFKSLANYLMRWNLTVTLALFHLSEKLWERKIESLRVYQSQNNIFHLSLALLLFLGFSYWRKMKITAIGFIFRTENGHQIDLERYFECFMKFRIYL